MEVLDSSRKVVEKSRFVSIDTAALKKFSEMLWAKDVSVPRWEAGFHFRGNEEETVAYLLVLDTLNFCFWPASGKRIWEIPYKSGWVSGYYALALSLKRAFETGTPLAEPEYMVSLTLDGLKEVLGGRGELQLLKSRLQILRELGKVLLERFDGKAFKIVKCAHGSAVALARLLAESLSSFRDVAKYWGEKVYFYKRAQIFAADLYGTFSGEGWGHFTDMQELTAFADYKLPQVLRHVGILYYQQGLGDKVDQKILLEAGGVEEIEIRANTIVAVEGVRQELAKLGSKLRAFEMDWILWNLGQEEAFKEKPYHRTITIFY
ncbi:MAG: queuosine salvage family protein [Deltaproteobacteria bacterium]